MCPKPTLFSLLINDLAGIFDNLCEPTKLSNKNVSCLLYADDVVLLSEFPSGLQRCVDKLNDYCIKWSLTVNIAKTKIIVFNKSGKVLKDTFYYDNNVLVNSNEYEYLGIIFKPSGSFSSAIDHLYRKARTAIFSIRKMLFSDKMNIPPHLKPFDSCVKPIL